MQFAPPIIVSTKIKTMVSKTEILKNHYTRGIPDVYLSKRIQISCIYINQLLDPTSKSKQFGRDTKDTRKCIKMHFKLSSKYTFYLLDIFF